MTFPQIFYFNFDLYKTLNIIDKVNRFLPQTLIFYPYIFATRSRKPLLFQTMNSVRSKSQRLKYQRFTPHGFKDKEIRKFEFVEKTQFLCQS